MSPYPDPATIYCHLVISNLEDDMFANVYLSDMYSFFFSFRYGFSSVMVNKRITRHCLLVDSSIKGNLRGLLERGVQESMDKEEVFNKTLKVAIGYAGSIGTSLWSKIKEDRTKVVWLSSLIMMVLIPDLV
jgi:hypothetical protein